MNNYLIYHIYADGDMDMLEFHMLYLLKYIGEFKRHVIKITYDDPAKLEWIQKNYLRFLNTKVYTNNPRIGETVGFLEALEEIHESWEVNKYRGNKVFIASTNGVSKKDPEQRANVRAWSRAMYMLNMGSSFLAQNAFEKGFNCFGSFKRDTPMDKGGRVASWHYSGLFYWLNADELFRREWNNIDNTRHTIETYPGLLFESKEAYCHYNAYDSSGHYLDLYQNRLPDDWMKHVIQ